VGFESLAIKIAALAALVGLIVLAVKALVKQGRAIGGQDEHEASHKATDAARLRFDRAVSRALSANMDALIARYRARVARRKRVLRPPSDD
jgi:hypothetical protein